MAPLKSEAEDSSLNIPSETINESKSGNPS